MTQTLPDVALSAWDAYRAMEESKREYFGYLADLETKYQHGGARTIAESMRLDSLLSRHDRQVAGFRKAIKVLKARDAGAHRALIAHITMLNSELGKGDGVEPD